jgi:glutamate-1-semialdehyde 2,1-aminomutase
MNSNDMKNYALEEDREFFERELASFVPERIFDAHCHLYNRETVGEKKGLMLPSEGFPRDMGYHEYSRLIDCLHPGRRVSSLFIPFTFSRDALAGANEWVAQQVSMDSSCRGLFFVTPQDDPEWVRDRVRRLGLHGLKCYHLWSPVTPTWEADIPDYLPEKLVKVADEEGWVITLHMVKSRAVADPGNIRWIRHYCETYPNMKLILAHSARGFQPAHNLEGLPKLTGLNNLFFDSSANCESVAHESVIRIIGHKKLLYGSDFHVSHFRGRSVAAADSFLWIYGHTPVWGEKHMQIKPVLAGLESLRSLKWACWSARLSDKAIEDIFWNNAAGLFGIGR